MPREVFAISLTPEDGKYAKEYAERVGIRPTTLLQTLTARILDELRKEPMPEPVENPVPPEKLPQNMAFWKQYKKNVEESQKNISGIIFREVGKNAKTKH